MKTYISIYPPLPLGRGEPVVRIYSSMEDALKLKHESCLAIFQLDTETKEASEISSKAPMV